MFNIGFTELIILGVIGLLVLGPEQLPEVARKMAKLFNELKRAKDEILSPVEDLKAEATRMLERARESAAQKELDELLHRIDPNKLAEYDPFKPKEPTSLDGNAPLPNDEPVQQEMALDEGLDTHNHPIPDEHYTPTEPTVNPDIHATDLNNKDTKKNV